MVKTPKNIKIKKRTKKTKNDKKRIKLRNTRKRVQDKKFKKGAGPKFQEDPQGTLIIDKKGEPIYVPKKNVNRSASDPPIKSKSDSLSVRSKSTGSLNNLNPSGIHKTLNQKWSGIAQVLKANNTDSLDKRRFIIDNLPKSEENKPRKIFNVSKSSKDSSNTPIDKEIEYLVPQTELKEETKEEEEEETAMVWTKSNMPTDSYDSDATDPEVDYPGTAETP